MSVYNIHFLFLFCISIWAVGNSNSSTICQSKINKDRKSCYWIDSTPVNHTVSEEHCASRGGHLATINSPATADFVKGFLQDFFDFGIWIGYDERKNTWNDGMPIAWTDFGPTEPDQEWEYCVILYYETARQWADIHCGTPFKGLCEISVNSTEVTAFFTLSEAGSVLRIGDHINDVSDDLPGCTTTCQDDPGCYFIKFNQTGHLCKLYKKGGTELIIPIDSREWYIFNRNFRDVT